MTLSLLKSIPIVSACYLQGWYGVIGLIGSKEQRNKFSSTFRKVPYSEHVNIFISDLFSNLNNTDFNSYADDTATHVTGDGEK